MHKKFMKLQLLNDFLSAIEEMFIEYLRYRSNSIGNILSSSYLIKLYQKSLNLIRKMKKEIFYLFL